MVKHAGPAQAAVPIGYGADDLEIEVVDDGRGAAPTRDRSAAGTA